MGGKFSEESSVPVCSVVMAAYNGQDLLQASVDSILSQTFTDFEFIIVDDCSTDETYNLLKSYRDPRIKIFRNDTNRGLAASLNRGIDNAAGKYIARMDADDISINTRLEKQIRFMENNPNVGLLGTYAQYFGKVSSVRKHPVANNELKVRSLFSSQFCHPTVVIRKSVLDVNKLRYNEHYRTAQDYELWCRMIPFTDFASLPECLLKYFVHNAGLSNQKRQNQLENTYQIQRSLLKNIGIEPTEDDVKLNWELADFSFQREPSKINNIMGYFNKLIAANARTNFFPSPYFAHFLAEYYYNIIKCSKLPYLDKLQRFYQSGLGRYLDKNLVFLRMARK